MVDRLLTLHKPTLTSIRIIGRPEVTHLLLVEVARRVGEVTTVIYRGLQPLVVGVVHIRSLQKTRKNQTVPDLKSPIMMMMMTTLSDPRKICEPRMNVGMIDRTTRPNQEPRQTQTKGSE